MKPPIDDLRTLDVLFHLIKKGPDRTELELAQAIYGDAATQQDVNQDCRVHVRNGLVERKGTGGRADPYRYHLKSVSA